jgi:flagellar protein FlaG
MTPLQPALPMAAESQRPEAAPPRAAPPEPKSAKSEKKTSQSDPAVTERVVEALQKYLNSMNVNLKFKVHKATGAVVVSVVNVDTGAVIRQIPPEQMLDAIAKLDELVGTLLDTKT